MAIIKSISISKEFDELAEKHHLSWTEAARIGMSILLSDLGLKEYDNRLNLYRKMQFYQKLTEDLSAKMMEFEKANAKL